MEKVWLDITVIHTSLITESMDGRNFHCEPLEEPTLTSSAGERQPAILLVQRLLGSCSRSIDTGLLCMVKLCCVQVLLIINVF